MHIHQIVIDNFKSFGEKTVIPFERGFTTISGPNGSGKSNIIDSILFCLGLSTSRTMRAEKLSDLINNLSKRKECSVTITFRKEPHEIGTLPEKTKQQSLELDQPAKADDTDPTDENADSRIEDAPPAEDEDELKAEPIVLNEALLGEFVQVTRRIKKGSQTYNSSYYLNGAPTTLTEIHDYLAHYHISPGTYNVMMQGDVAGIVNMSGVERRKIIDEIAGIAEFDRKIDQALKELETTSGNIERNNILLLEIEQRLEQLLGERDHALKYQKLRDERQKMEGMVLSVKFVGVHQAIQSTLENIAEVQKKKQSGKADLATLGEQLVLIREELRQISEEVKRKGEDQQIAIRKQVESLKGHIARKEDTIAFNDKKAAENTQRVEQLQADIQRQTENIETIDAELAGFQHQLKELQDLFGQEQKSYEAINRKFDALTGSGGELAGKRAEIRQKLTAEEDELSRLNREKLDVEAALERTRMESERHAREQAELSGRQDSLSRQEMEASRNLKNLEDEKAAFEAQLKHIQTEYSQTRVQLNTQQTAYNDLHRQFVQTEARKRAMDEVNFTRAVETVLNAGMKGVHGTLAQLGRVEGEFGTAVETAMGARVQNVVVDNDKVAQAGIELLQRNKAGRATFLPISKMKRAYDLPSLPSNPGVIDFAINLVEYLPQYHDIFAYALGDTLVVEDINSARPLMQKYRMVTLDGSLLEKSGAMTGGSRGNQVRGYFSGGNAEAEITKLQDQLSDAEVARDKTQQTLTQIELKMESVKEAFGQCVTQYSKAVIELESLQSRMKELDHTQAVRADGGATPTAIQNLEKQLETALKTITVQESTVLLLQEELNGIEQQLPTDALEGLRQEMSDVKFQMDYYDSQVRNLQADIKGKEMERNYQQVGIQDCKTRIEETTAEAETLRKENKDAREEIELTQKQITELEAQTAELDEELKKLQAERDAIQNKLIEHEKQKSILERELAQLEEQIIAFQARKKELQPQLEALRAEVEAAGLVPDDVLKQTLPAEEELNRSIQKLTRQMEAMEPVNMLAIDEYERVSERRNELAEKITTLANERDSIQERINSYHELKRNTFMEAFNAVDQNFKTIFAELSDGVGHLALTNTENPFEGGMVIYAQPRGKKVQRIEAMSGGEKSLTSLAFVFSLQQYMPAPFYALDEVDMNLDGINAEKLANMVKREARSAQFVVVSLRKPMLEHSHRTVGVTQRANGVTRVTGIKHRDEDDVLTTVLEETVSEADETATHAGRKPRKKGAAVAAAS
ncbi:MAG: chromosome segregation protein SMC [Candidatus Melainabacteria bacterium]